MSSISKVWTGDARFHIDWRQGSDTIHKDPIYSYVVTLLLHHPPQEIGSSCALTPG